MRAPWEQSESRATAWPPKVSFYRTCTGSGDSTATLTMLDLSLSLWKVMANPSILGGCNNVLDMVPPKYHLECEITTANLVGLKWSVTPPVQNCVGCEFGRSLLAELPKPGLSDLLNSGTEDWSGNWSSWHAPMPTKVMANPRPHLVEVTPTCPPAETAVGELECFLMRGLSPPRKETSAIDCQKVCWNYCLTSWEKVLQNWISLFFILFILFKSFGFLSCHLTVTRFVTVGAQGCGWVWHF